jgi:hypothetical protein
VIHRRTFVVSFAKKCALGALFHNADRRSLSITTSIQSGMSSTIIG